MKVKVVICIIAGLLIHSGVVADGGGTAAIGYQFNDETGNLGFYQPTYNSYEGAAISIEDFRYTLDNGIRFKANLRNITLNNRNLMLAVEKNGLFGLRLNNNQYRRTYDFDGLHYTRRHTTSGAVWFYPIKYAKLFGSGKFIGKEGRQVEYFDPVSKTTAVPVDYDQKEFTVGFQALYEGRMLQADFRKIDFDADNDQERTCFKIHGYAPLPRFEWIRVSGGFRRFETKHTDTDFKIVSNRGWGGAGLNLPYNLDLKYNFVFDRTVSDSDFVATDNIINTAYLGYRRPGRYGVMIGYQNGISDDFDTEISSNAFYFSGWVYATSRLELKTEFGAKYEELDTGTRLTGDQDLIKHHCRAKYRFPKNASVQFKYDNRVRKNEAIGSEIEFNRYSFDGTVNLPDYAVFTGGYAYANGCYNNTGSKFEFGDHLFYGDISSTRIRDFILGAGITYYRSLRDLDLERIHLRFRGQYFLPGDFQLELIYNVHNQDDLLVFDNQYYTANIVNINLKRDFKL